MKYGPVRFYENGLKPLVTQFKDLRLSAREAELAGTALDIMLHTRMLEMMDLLDNFATRSKLEQGIETMTSKIGVLGGFDYWNVAMKKFGAAVFNAEMMDSIQTVLEKGHKGARSLKKAQDFLASLNIRGVDAADIWELVSKAEGGGKVGNVWLPNTEDWVKAAEKLKMPAARAEELQRLYHAALVREVDSMIVTPGLERPLWMDRTLAGKMVGQFRSFNFASTTKTVLAGLQEQNANFALGTAISLGLGTLSYALYGAFVGLDKKNSPFNQPFSKWMDEAIDRSGMLGVLAEVRRVGATVPWLNDYVMFSGQQSTRWGGQGLAGALGGPSFDLATTAADVATTLIPHKNAKDGLQGQ